MTRTQMQAVLFLENARLVEHEGQPAPAPRPMELPRPRGGDVHEAGGVGILHADRLRLPQDAKLRAELRAPDEAQVLRGIEVTTYAATAAQERRRDDLALLIACFRHVSLRVREVHTYLDSLPRGEAEHVADIRRGRGRPRDLGNDLASVYTLDRLRVARRISIAAAAKILGPLVHLTSERLRNLHTNLAAYAHIRADGLFVRAARLAPTEWGEAPMMNVDAYVIR